MQGNSGPAGTAELHRFDLATGKRSPDLVAKTPGFSGQINPVFDAASGALVGLSMLTDTRATAWLVPAMQAVQAKVDAALPGRANELQCRRCDQPNAVLVQSTSDRVPGNFLLYRPADKPRAAVVLVHGGP